MNFCLHSLEFILFFEQAERPERGRTWLLPVHVPDHWAMVTFCWEQAEVRFYDSLPKRAEAVQDEKQVKVLVWNFLGALVQHFGVNLCLSQWTWVSEKVR